MIELIFVIVIIGILAAIAVPKLLATRDDARISERASNITNAANEIAAYAVSQGTANINIQTASNVVQSMIDRQVATLDANGVLNIKMNSITDCLKMKIDGNGNDANLTITYGNAGSDRLCKALQKIVDSEQHQIPIHGRYVVM